MYFAAKKLGRCHFADKPTTAMVRELRRMRRIPAMSSTIGTIRPYREPQDGGAAWG